MKPKITDVTIGADIEVFVKDDNRDVIVTAEPFIKGTKYKPFLFDENDPYAGTSLDNVMAEYTIKPARDCVAFVGGINKALSYVKSILPEGYSLSPVPAAVLNDEFLVSEAARLFGCESDNNVWLRCTNPKPTATNQNLRSAGFHVHLGYEDPSLEVTEEAVKAMDLFLSVPSVLIEPDNERRKLYGKAGAFRIKPYGFEHRVLSGYFGSTDELKEWVFNNTEAAVKFVNDFRIDELDAVEDLIQAAINNSDKTIAGNLIRQFEIPML